MQSAEGGAGMLLVRIRAKSWDALRDLQRDLDLDVFGPTARELPEGDFEIQGLLTGVEVDLLRSRGYGVEVVSDADKVARERLRDISKAAAGKTDRESGSG